ncbi:uncharacterized protein LOC108623605 [Ceratina calcarata]|uniref:ribonuclease H n=1 Tax=Ceratina calcarata TaxID=156304 RepID=A0AAJ7ISY4_9HYME|nr:uncharacterized protein LOC108622718 [Ceratina calcarata]XP_017877688.1 uncharacterized protein LOC108623605 [Ceratina calcarata]
MEALLCVAPLKVKVEETALRTISLLNNWGTWIGNDKEHASIEKTAEMETGSRLTYILNAPSDRITPIYRFGRKFKTIIMKRTDWTREGTNKLEGCETWYTDGSKDEEGYTGCAWTANKPNTGFYEHMSKDNTVFQAEVLGITRCTEMLENKTRKKRIAIFTDSQATIKALSSNVFMSRLVLECRDKLNLLAVANIETVVGWCPGHKGIKGNEKADRLARVGGQTKKIAIGPEPWIPIPYAVNKQELRRYSSEKLKRRWEETSECRQGKIMIGEPNIKKAKTITTMTKKEARIAAYTYTGHAPVGYHLHKMGLLDNGKCTVCPDEDETTYHILAKCVRYTKTRREIFKCSRIEIDEVKSLRSIDIVNFMIKTEPWNKEAGVIQL